MPSRKSTQPDPAPPPRHALTPVLAGGLAGCTWWRDGLDGHTYVHAPIRLTLLNPNLLDFTTFQHPGIEICLTFPCEFTKTQVRVLLRIKAFLLPSLLLLPSSCSPSHSTPLCLLPAFPHLLLQCQLKQHYQLNAFSGPVDCVRYTLRTKGPSGLYKGLTPWLVFAFPRSAVRFSTYEYASHALQSGLNPNAGPKKLDPLLAMTAGTLAGASKYRHSGAWENTFVVGQT